MFIFVFCLYFSCFEGCMCICGSSTCDGFVFEESCYMKPCTWCISTWSGLGFVLGVSVFLLDSIPYVFWFII